MLVSQAGGQRMSEIRRLVAILVADVVGYSRLAGADEDRTLARLRGLRSDLIDPAITAHRRRIDKHSGDGAIIEFRTWSTRYAVRSKCRPASSNATPAFREGRIELRVGIHLGDVVEEADGDLMGDGVNTAARLVMGPFKWTHYGNFGPRAGGAV